MTIADKIRRSPSDHEQRRGLAGDLAGLGGPRRDDAPLEGATRRSLLRRRKDERVPAEPSLAATWTTGSRLTTRTLRWVIAGSMLAGPTAVALHFLDAPAPPAPVAATGLDERLMSRRSVASEVAAHWVQLWLTTPQERAGDLAAVFPGPVHLPKTAATVANVRVLDALPAAPGAWAVTVGVDVTPPKQPVVRRYYQVPVAVSGEAGQVSAAPAAVPAQVSGPRSTDASQGAYIATVSTTSPLGQTVSAYLTSALTGQGDVARYVTPGRPLQAIATGPGVYASVQVQSIQASQRVPGAVDDATPPEGDTVHVLVQAVLAEKGAPQGEGRATTYPLTLRARDGRWEISAIDAALYQPDDGTRSGASTSSATSVH